MIDKTLSLNESIDKNSLFEKFMSYACQELQINNPPTLEIKYEFGEEQPSFGAGGAARIESTLLVYN